MESLVAKVVEALVGDVIEAVRSHESYKALVKTLAEQTLAQAAAQAVQTGPAPAGA